jgi:hypothetical protein
MGGIALSASTMTANSIQLRKMQYAKTGPGVTTTNLQFALVLYFGVGAQ